jgi:exosortase A
MQPEAISLDGGAPAAGMPVVWRAALIRLSAIWLGLIVLFFGDWRDMVGQWWNSSTYNHILLIPPIIGWLVAQRRDEVLRLTPVGWWPGLILFAGAGAFWLLGDFAGLSLARQLAVVVMAQAGFAVVMGPEVVAGLLFPLFYMIFLVPIGDEMIPALQTLTARLTMVFLGLAHIPSTINGVFITTPAGYFEVAEACSGIKFLIAMVAYGALVANGADRRQRVARVRHDLDRRLVRHPLCQQFRPCVLWLGVLRAGHGAVHGGGLALFRPICRYTDDRSGRDRSASAGALAGRAAVGASFSPAAVAGDRARLHRLGRGGAIVNGKAAASGGGAAGCRLGTCPG